MISEPANSSGPVGNYPAPARRSSPVAVLVAWAVVALPAAWGIYMTAMTSVQLFKPTAPAAAPAAQAAPAPGPQR